MKFISDNYFYLNKKIFILNEEQKKWVPYSLSMEVELIKGI